MAVIAVPHARTGSVLASLTARLRRLRGRYQLTEQERRNLQIARARAAVYTASLGGHPFHP